jgi:hypothetical protein
MTYVNDRMIMAANVRCRFGTAELPARSVESRIGAFLDGKTNGEELLHALYDHVLREPIPQAMRALLKEQQVGAR